MVHNFRPRWWCSVRYFRSQTLLWLWYLLINYNCSLSHLRNDIAQDATAYAHRDALFYLQSYAVGVGKVPESTKEFLRGVNSLLKNGTPGGDKFGAYAGYVDPELPNGPEAYWRANLPRLEQIKYVVDPSDVFHNPKSVSPNAA